MIEKSIFERPLAAARMQSFENRFDCAAQGMKFALSQFKNNTRRFRSRLPSRHPSGFNGISDNANELYRVWQSGAVTSTLLDSRISALIQRIENWLILCNGKNFKQDPVNATKTLYWQVAWCVASDYYKHKALALVRSRSQMVSMKSPVNYNSPYGNINYFGNGSTAQGTAFSTYNVLYRGDNRSPKDIFDGGGFFGRDYNNNVKYKPWFQGQAMGGTVSTTTKMKLALNAGGKAARHFGPSEPAVILPWMRDAILDEQKNGRISAGRIVARAYVYDIRPNGTESMRVTNSPHAPGTEEVFLAIPNANISRWWLHLDQPKGLVLGPFPFTLPNILGTLRSNLQFESPLPQTDRETLENLL